MKLPKIKIVVDDPKYTPQYATEGSGCLDLFAKLDAPVSIPGRHLHVIDCGFAMEVPSGWMASITMRSGLGSKGLMLPNGPGIIDSDYRGKIKVIVGNIGREILVINPGDRIAQMHFVQVNKAVFEEVKELTPTTRGAGGLGSTGK